MSGPFSELFFGSLILLLSLGTFAALTLTGEQFVRAVRSLLPAGRETEAAGWPRSFPRLRSPDGYSAEGLGPRLDAVCRRAEALRRLSAGEPAPVEAPEGRLCRFPAPPRPPEAFRGALPLPEAGKLLQASPEEEPGRAGGRPPEEAGWRL